MTRGGFLARLELYGTTDADDDADVAADTVRPRNLYEAWRALRIR